MLEAVAKVKSANPRALYCCDPVMGDVGRGFFVREGIPGFMRARAVPAADLITPNRFELEYLSGLSAATLDGALAASERARALGPDLVLTTSLVFEDEPEGTIGMLAVSGEGAWLVQTPLLPLSVNGAGDATAALFLAHHLNTGDPARALSKTASSMHAVLEATRRARSQEIRLVEAQDDIADPTDRFPARRLG